MPSKSIVKKLLELKCTAVDRISYEGDKVIMDVHPTKNYAERCGCCGRKGRYYDKGRGVRLWRSSDHEGTQVYLRSYSYRIRCERCKAVHTNMVPWASHGSSFTHRFEETVTWLALQMDKTAVSKFMHIAWATVGEIMSRVVESVAKRSASPLDGLVNIGIDETSYRKGHSYITVVVDHDTSRVVWAREGHSEEVLSLFFMELGEERCRNIRLVSCDGARWIRNCIENYCENAERCVDPFHVVQWGMTAMDKVRQEQWQRARVEERQNDRKRERGRPPRGGEKKESLAAAIKGSKYAVGKADGNLTESQRKKLELLEIRCPVLYRARCLKESLRVIFSMEYEQAKYELGRWLSWAQRCRIPAFMELRRKILRHYDGILASIRYGLSNARIEAINNKIKLVIRMAYGFRNMRNMLDMIKLKCGCYTVNLPWEPAENVA